MSCLFGFLVYDDRLLSILPTLYSKVILHAGSELFFDVQKHCFDLKISREQPRRSHITRGENYFQFYLYQCLMILYRVMSQPSWCK